MCIFPRSNPSVVSARKSKARLANDSVAVDTVWRDAKDAANKEDVFSMFFASPHVQSNLV